MDQTAYRLAIRARDGQEFDPDSRMLESRLGRIPGVRIDGRGHFSFGEADEHGVMEIEVEDSGCIAIRIPRPWVMERGPQVFALVFMAAEWCHGEVFDPQIDDTLQKEVVLQGLVAVRQAWRERDQQSGSSVTPPDTIPTTDPEAPGKPKRPWWKKG